MKDYSVKLVARNEGIEYRDAEDVYRFNVAFVDKMWVVELPCSKGEQFAEHALSDDERKRILPRIERYLRGRKYFWFFGPTHEVRFEPPISVVAPGKAQ